MATVSLVIACLFCVATYLQDSTLLRYWYGAIAILFFLAALGFLRHVLRAVDERQLRVVAAGAARPLIGSFDFHYRRRIRTFVR